MIDGGVRLTVLARDLTVAPKNQCHVGKGFVSEDFPAAYDPGPDTFTKSFSGKFVNIVGVSGRSLQPMDGNGRFRQWTKMSGERTVRFEVNAVFFCNPGGRNTLFFPHGDAHAIDAAAQRLIPYEE